MNTYQNTFEILGEPWPYEAADEREYAELMLELFKLPGTTGYFIGRSKPQAVGKAEEAEWTRRLWEKLTPTDDEDKCQIDQETLLDFLKEVDPDCLLGHPDEQDEWDQLPEEYKDHLKKAVVHAAGKGPHPGKYHGPEPHPYLDSRETDEVDLQREQDGERSWSDAFKKQNLTGPSVSILLEI
jgi:hypothetical protein